MNKILYGLTATISLSQIQATASDFELEYFSDKIALKLSKGETVENEEVKELLNIIEKTHIFSNQEENEIDIFDTSSKDGFKEEYINLMSEVLIDRDKSIKDKAILFIKNSNILEEKKKNIRAFFSIIFNKLR